MPRKVRELVADLLANGFVEIAGGGKGSHSKFVHDRYAGVLTLSGQAGEGDIAGQPARHEKTRSRRPVPRPIDAARAESSSSARAPSTPRSSVHSLT